MRRSSYGAFLAAFGLVLGAGVYADTGSASNRGPSALEQSMGDIQWGWTPKQVYQHLKKNIEASYQEPISKTTDAIEEDRLRHKLEQEAAQIRDSYIEFDGTPSAYDSGYLKGEFTHRNGESLIRVRTKTTQDYFFFIKERLWKRYRAFDASVFQVVRVERAACAGASRRQQRILWLLLPDSRGSEDCRETRPAAQESAGEGRG